MPFFMRPKNHRSHLTHRWTLGVLQRDLAKLTVLGQYIASTRIEATLLLSMTGHGDASGQNERIRVTAEVRSVNNRHLKVTVRCPDSFLALEANIDRLVRELITRGTLTIHLHVKQLGEKSSFALNTTVAKQYYDQMRSLATSLGIDPPATVQPLINLPGVIEGGEGRTIAEEDWPLIEEVLVSALENLQNFRKTEGANMAAELQSLSNRIEQNSDLIASRTGSVLTEYREKIKTRLNEILTNSGIELEDKDIIREIAIFADRCDITEELTRLRSHLQQYKTILASDGSNGRKLEFLGQEIFREVNTTGSKANDIGIAHIVVEMKADVEKMREIVLNVE